MMNWSEVDGALLRESIKLAKPVRDSIEAQVNIDEIIRQWNLSYREGSEVTTAEARAWAKVNVVVDNTELNKGLGILYAIGWMFGRDVATSAYAHARLNKAAPTDDQLNGLLNIDWANWKPGNNPGALLAAPPGGLKGLLQRRGLDLQGLTNTLLNRIGTQLANALTSGATDTVLSKALEAIVGDPERALTIANTSMASAMSVSTRETYQEFGLAKMRWLALEPCETCSGNGAMGPVTPGEAVFKNVQGDNITEPPAHPNCRCALSPVIDLDQFKFSNTQARDDRGRWTSGGGAGVRPDKNTNPNEYMSVADYTDGSGHYSEVNDYLRGTGDYLSSEEIGKVKETTKDLENLIDVSPPLEIGETTYRGISNNDQEVVDRFSQLQAGDSFVDPAFTSLSRDMEVARGFMIDKEGIVLKVELPKGTKVLDINAFRRTFSGREKEVILAPKTKFVVSSPAAKIDGITVIGLKVENG